MRKNENPLIRREEKFIRCISIIIVCVTLGLIVGLNRLGLFLDLESQLLYILAFASGLIIVFVENLLICLFDSKYNYRFIVCSLGITSEMLFVPTYVSLNSNNMVMNNYAFIDEQGLTIAKYVYLVLVAFALVYFIYKFSMDDGLSVFDYIVGSVMIICGVISYHCVAMTSMAYMHLGVIIAMLSMVTTYVTQGYVDGKLKQRKKTKVVSISFGDENEIVEVNNKEYQIIIDKNELTNPNSKE